MAWAETSLNLKLYLCTKANCLVARENIKKERRFFFFYNIKPNFFLFGCRSFYLVEISSIFLTFFR